MRMRLVSRGIVVALLAVFASLAPAVRGKPDPLNISSLFSKVTIANRGHVPITGAFYKESSDSKWGKNELLAPINPGGEFVMSYLHLIGCSYDIEVWYNYTTNSEYLNVDVCAYGRIGFAGPPAANFSGPFPTELTIENMGPADMLGFRMLPSSSSAKTFGPNLLPAGPLRKDQSAVIPLVQIGAGTCLFDMEADFPGGTTNIAIGRISASFLAWDFRPRASRALPCRRRRLPCRRARRGRRSGSRCSAGNPGADGRQRLSRASHYNQSVALHERSSR